MRMSAADYHKLDRKSQMEIMREYILNPMVGDTYQENFRFIQVFDVNPIKIIMHDGFHHFNSSDELDTFFRYTNKNLGYWCDWAGRQEMEKKNG